MSRSWKPRRRAESSASRVKLTHGLSMVAAEWSARDADAAEHGEVPLTRGNAAGLDLQPSTRASLVARCRSSRHRRTRSVRCDPTTGTRARHRNAPDRAVTCSEQRQRGTLVCLNSLRSVHSRRSSTRSTSVGVLAVHDAHERGALADDERRHAEHVPALVGFGVLLGEDLQRPARRDLGGDRVGVEADRRRDLARAPRPWRSCGPRRGGPRTRRCASRGSGRRTSRARRCPTAARSRRCPTLGFALPHRRSRPPRRAPGRARTAGSGRPSRGRRAARDDRLVAVAGEGAAIVEAHGELTGHGASDAGIECVAAFRGSA